jgi:hypothetical protein
VPALKAWSPEFKPHSYPNKTKQNKKGSATQQRLVKFLHKFSTFIVLLVLVSGTNMHLTEQASSFGVILETFSLHYPPGHSQSYCAANVPHTDKCLSVFWELGAISLLYLFFHPFWVTVIFILRLLKQATNIYTTSHTVLRLRVGNQVMAEPCFLWGQQGRILPYLF